MISNQGINFQQEQRRILALTEGNAGACHIIRRHFHGHTIPKQNTNIVLAHFTRKISKHFMTIIKPHTELGPWQGFDHQTINFDFAFFFCHTRILTDSIHYP